MLYEDVVLGGTRASQYSPSVGEGHFLIYLFKKNTYSAYSDDRYFIFRVILITAYIGIEGVLTAKNDGTETGNAPCGRIPRVPLVA